MNYVVNTGGASNSTVTTVTGTWDTGYSYNQYSQYESPAGTGMKMEYKEDSEGHINPRLYFSYVKHKMTILNQAELSLRLRKLKKMIMASKEMDQQAMYEQLSIQLAIAVKEQEALVADCGKRIPKNLITKFLRRVKNKTVKMGPLDSFPRVIPAKVRKKIKYVQSLGIFDEYVVVYNDYTEEELKTNKEKIKEKDPILFGKFKFSPDMYYFIADWVDMYCDLTLDKLVDSIKERDPEFELDQIPDMDQSYVDMILKEVNTRFSRLEKTNPSNYRDLMDEEDKDRNPRKKSKKNKKKRKK